MRCYIFPDFTELVGWCIVTCQFLHHTQPHFHKASLVVAGYTAPYISPQVMGLFCPTKASLVLLSIQHVLIKHSSRLRPEVHSTVWSDTCMVIVHTLMLSPEEVYCMFLTLINNLFIFFPLVSCFMSILSSPHLHFKVSVSPSAGTLGFQHEALTPCRFGRCLCFRVCLSLWSGETHIGHTEFAKVTCFGVEKGNIRAPVVALQIWLHCPLVHWSILFRKYRNRVAN